MRTVGAAPFEALRSPTASGLPPKLVSASAVPPAAVTRSTTQSAARAMSAGSPPPVEIEGMRSQSVSSSRRVVGMPPQTSEGLPWAGTAAILGWVRARALAPQRLLRRPYQAVVGPPVADPVKGWPGTAHPDLPTVRMLHVGDCSLRSMESSHDFCAPLGYPRVAAQALLEQGIGTEFSHYFAVLFEHLPDMELLRRRMKLSGDPDVIVVQVGASYARRLILPDTRAIMRLRSDLGRRLGPRVFNVYRPLRPVVRH